MDKKEALKLVQESGHELENLPDEFKKDKEIVLIAVKQSDEAIQYIDESLKEYFFKYTLESSELNYSCLDFKTS